MKSSLIRKLHQQLKEQQISVSNLTEQYLKKAKEKNTELNAYTTICEEYAQERAQFVDNKIQSGEDINILSGIPMSLKDIVCTKNIQSTGASHILQDFYPPYNATVAQQLYDQDAILLGKNNCDEFAQGGSNEHSAFGPCKNPHDITKVSGGSSGGSASAVAADTAVYAIGTDTGGSIRQPAAFCGCVGLKATYGRVSRFGVMAMASSWDTVGPITQTVEDAAIVLDHIAGKDPLDATTIADKPTSSFTDHLTGNIKGLTIGIPEEYFAEGLDPKIKERTLDAISYLEKQGAHIQEISLPMTRYAVACYYVSVPAEVSSNMARYDGIRFGPAKEHYPSLEELYVQNRTEGFGQEVKRRIMLGTYVLSHGSYDAYYKKSQQVRTLVINDFKEAFTKVDIIATPVSPILPFDIGSIQDPLQMYLADAYTIPASAAGIPGLSVPIGTIDQLPVGLQLLGKWKDEGTLLNTGGVLEDFTAS